LKHTQVTRGRQGWTTPIDIEKFDAKFKARVNVVNARGGVIFIFFSSHGL